MLNTNRQNVGLDFGQREIEALAFVCSAIELSVSIYSPVTVRRTDFIMSMAVWNNRFKRSPVYTDRNGSRAATKREKDPPSHKVDSV
jgi:hypothetical protein